MICYTATDRFNLSIVCEAFSVKKLVALSLMAIIIASLLGCDSKKSESLDYAQKITHAICAKFEFNGETDDGYKIITSETPVLTRFFDNVILIPQDTPFNEDWIYRITFNWNEIAKGSPEIIVLIGKASISIDGDNYTTEDGVPFSAVLNNFAGKYKYFDYALQYD